MQLTGPCPAALLEADAPQEVAGAPSVSLRAGPCGRGQAGKALRSRPHRNTRAAAGVQTNRA